MKKALKIILIVGLILAFAAAALAIWQWSNIKALYMAFNTSPEKITALIEENDAKTNEILGRLTDSKMRTLSDEERKQLEEGTLSEEDAIKLITEGNKDSAYNQDKKEKSVKIDEIISRIYLLRAEYLNALGALEAEAVSTAKAIPKKERTMSKKLELVENFTGRGVALEGQCDSKMNKLLSELKVELEKTGGDMKVISDIKALYASEKELKKSELFSKYNVYK